MLPIHEKFNERLAIIESKLHQNAEPSFREYLTTEIIKGELLKIGLELIDMGLETGVVARLRAKGNGPSIGLRADIDALKQQEKVDRPDRSINEGVMHACGHDVHATGLIGAAMALSDRKEELSGDVIFIFQPAEETIQGARKLIDNGLFEKARIDRMFGLHITPTMEVGKIGVKCGSLMAGKDDFHIKVHGLGGHGGIPDRCVDPIVASCGIVNALQTIVSRNVNPFDTAVVSICSIHGGTTDNLIVDEVVLTGSARTMRHETKKKVLDRIIDISGYCAQAYGCEVEFDHYASTPPLINDPEMTAIARVAACATVGADDVAEPAGCMASDDFSEYGQYVPSFFYFIGSGFPGKDNPSWHNACFRAAPGTALWGASILTNSVFAAQGRL